MKYLKKLIAAAIILVIAFLLFDCSMQKKAETHEGFTEDSFWSYHFYTDQEVKDAPRISKNYHFLFRAQDGGKPGISAIVFAGAADTHALEQYLTQLGYHRVSVEGAEQRWEQPQKVTPAFYITVDEAQSEITLSKEGFKS